MARQPDGPKDDINWDEVWQRITGNKSSDDFTKYFKQGKVILILIGVAVVIWLLTGIYTVGPGEEGVVKTFGKHTATTSPGLNYHWPKPIQSVKRVNVEEIRTAEVGFRTVESDEFRTIKQEAQMLTGDENMVDAQMVVQYRVMGAADYLFNVKDPEQAVHFATEVALRSVVGRNTIDFVIIEGRSIVQDETKTFLQRLLDDYNAGIEVRAVKLQFAGPPEEVKDAFDEVVRAREDKQRLIREAEGYAADRVPKARGEAEKAILAAEAYQEQRVLEAEGDAAKFLKILREHEVPAAFQALAEYGSSEAIRILARVGAIEETVEQLLTEIGVTEEFVEGEETQNQIPETDEQSVSTPDMTRESLAAILVKLDVVSANTSYEDVTSQILFEALSELGIEGSYEEKYLEAIQLTRERLYLETMEDVLPATEIIVVDPDTGGNLMPFLPLKELTAPDQVIIQSEPTEEATQ